MLMGRLLLRLVSEACQMSMSAQVSIEYHWLVCTYRHLAQVAGFPKASHIKTTGMLFLTYKHVQLL